ncbi:polysaccharide deacetylase family protein [Nisaea sp.]|uniref:polysaccharide deacetylase family protein n=1 Tax=Nisaea sp. TaxID=2024842 RepID=UPI003B520429
MPNRSHFRRSDRWAALGSIPARTVKATFFLATACLFALFSGPVAAQEISGAVITMYHRFGENDFPSTNIRVEQFEEHIEELKKERYHVLPLPKVIDMLKSGQALEDRTIAITVDDAYLSVYEHAWPRLKEAGLPFTLFVATGAIDRQVKGYMSWDQIREMRDGGVTIGSQTRSHPHMTTLDRLALDRELAESNQRFVDELGAKPDLFAYPYGEYSLLVRKSVADAGFTAAFGQHSGVAYSGMDHLTLPRFALNERYGGIDRFRLIANALPLPVSDVLPEDTLLSENPPAFGFTLDESIGSPKSLSCFASSEGETHLEYLEQRVEVRLKQPFPPGRSRINCTMPGPDNRWRWFGTQFIVP